MAGRTTAFVLVGEHGAGPFQDREWKARHGVALIEKHRRVWIPTPVGHSSGERVPASAVYLPEGRTAAEELVVVVASCAIRASRVEEALRDEGLWLGLDGGFEVEGWIHVSDHRLEYGPAPTDALISVAVDEVRDAARLGVVRLEPTSALDDEGVLWLRTQGLDVDDFRQIPLGGTTE